MKFLSYLDVRRPRLLATQEQLLNLHLLSVSASASPVPSVPASFFLPTLGSVGPQCPVPQPSGTLHISSLPFHHPTPFPRLPFWSPALPTQSPEPPASQGRLSPVWAPSAQCPPAASLSMRREHPTMASGCRVAQSLASQMLPPHTRCPHTCPHSRGRTLYWLIETDRILDWLASEDPDLGGFAQKPGNGYSPGPRSGQSGEEAAQCHTMGLWGC